MPDLIFISLENWDDIWRRNQFVVAELARRYPGNKILFVGLPRDVSNAIRRASPADLLGASGPLNQHPNVALTRPLKLLPNTLAAGRAINQRMFARHVAAAAKRLSLRSPLLWINDQSAAHLCRSLGAQRVIYDVTDDWTALAQPPAVIERIRRDDAWLCRSADAVIVCSQRLLELKRPLVSHPTRLALIPNGVDAEHYRPAWERDAPPPPPLTRRWGRPVLGYVGTIHPERLDVPLVAAVARALAPRGGSIALVGPNHLQAADRALLTAENIHFAGPAPYALIPRIMRAFDVCIAPHRVCAFTQSLNPIKLWEYLAVGKPIVSTRVAGFTDYPELVDLADNAEQFAAAAIAAIGEDATKPRARREEARRQSWRCRVDQIEELLVELPVAEPLHA